MSDGWNRLGDIILALGLGAIGSWVLHSEFHQHEQNAALDVCVIEGHKLSDGLSECVSLMQHVRDIENESECSVPARAAVAWSTD